MESGSLAQKIAYIQNNIKAVPQIFKKDFAAILKCYNIIQKKQQVYSILQKVISIKIQTFYRCLRPQIEFYKFEVGYYANPYLMIGIVAFKNKQYAYRSINWKLCTWVQSGGARCIPIKQEQSKQGEEQEKNNEIFEILKNIHALFIPQYTDSQSETYINKLINCIQKIGEKILVFTFGNSSNFILKKINDLQIQFKKNDFFFTKKEEVQVYSSYCGELSKDIDLKVRLMIQNRPKIATLQRKCLLTYQQIQKSKLFEQSQTSFYYSSSLNSFEIGSLCQNKQGAAYYFNYLNLSSLTNQESISFCHSIVNNFLNMARKDQKIVKQKYKMIGHYKLIYNENQNLAHYKIQKL